MSAPPYGECQCGGTEETCRCNPDHPEYAALLADLAEAHDVMSGEVWWRGGTTPSEVLELREPEDERRAA